MSRSRRRARTDGDLEGVASEQELIARLSRHFGEPRGITVGIGDDAAVLPASGGQWAWTIDTQIEDVHFRRAHLTLEDVGARSFHAAVSDLAAMGARPAAALSSLIVPARTSTRELEAIARGQAAAASSLDCPVIGGNVARGSELSVTTTALGRVRKPLRRSGAREGDQLYVLGELGMAALGFAWLEEHGASGRLPRDLRECCRAFRRPRALVAEGLKLAGRASGVIDVSDGLAGDAGHLAEQSAVCIVIEADALSRALSPHLVRASRRLDRDPLTLALHGGEDYALLFTQRRGKPLEGARRIGRVETGTGVLLEIGSRRTRLRGGFDHFA